VAGACSGLNAEQAEGVLREALTAAGQIGDEGSRSDALAAVAGAWRVAPLVAWDALRLIPRDKELLEACESLTDALPTLLGFKWEGEAPAEPPARGSAGASPSQILRLPAEREAQFRIAPVRFGSRGDADRFLHIAARWAGALRKMGKDEKEVVEILRFVAGG
jgi:hypothetical protein